jgi:hypothetical protein
MKEVNFYVGKRWISYNRNIVVKFIEQTFNYKVNIKELSECNLEFKNMLSGWVGIVENPENNKCVIIESSDKNKQHERIKELTEKHNGDIVCIVFQRNRRQKKNKYIYDSVFYPGSLDCLNERNNEKEPVDLRGTDHRMFFRGKMRITRKEINLLDESIFSGRANSRKKHNIKQENYFDEMTNHRLAISLPGIGVFCWREIECYALGIPVMMYKPVNVMHNNPQPDVHYINLGRRIRNAERSARRITEKYHEVIEDFEKLEYIRNNAHDWYAKNIQEPNTFSEWVEPFSKILNLV